MKSNNAGELRFMLKFSPRETFDRQLKHLQDEVLVMGSMVEQAVLESIHALKQRDIPDSRRIFANDKIINEKHFAIEQECLTLMATQQPMARDLRFLAAVLEINTELERIGDYAKGIAKISVLIGESELVMPVHELELMAEQGVNMLHRALTAFIARDLQAARSIPYEDEKVDELYKKFDREILDRMIADPSIIDRANYLIWVAHNLERSADRVTNICERILFVVTGELREFDVEDDVISNE